MRLEVIDQGIGNAATSPWAVSGTVTALIAQPLGVSGTVTTLQGTSPWIVSGGVDIGAPLPPGSNIIGGVNQGTSPWITSGGVTVSNFPATQAVTQSISPWIISGGVVLGNIPTVNQGTSPWIVSGGVDIGAPLPPGSNTIGTVNIGTLPSVNQGTGNAAGSPWSVSGNVSLLGTPNVSVTNQPTFNQGVLANNAYWSVSGQVSITNTPSVNQGTSPWVVDGPTASGTLFVNPPVMAAGADAGGIVRTLLTDSSGRQIIVGAAVAGSGSVGSPLPMGGQDSSGFQQFIRLANGGSTPGTVGIPTTSIQMYDTGGSTFRPLETAASANDAMGGVNHTAFAKLSYNGTNFDRDRNNLAAVLLTSAIRTSTFTSSDIQSFNLGGLHVILDITAGSGVLNLVINGKDPASAKYYTILSGATVSTTSTNVYRVFPAATPIANVTANDMLPATFQIVIQHANNHLVQYTVGYIILLL